ncbi:sensor histidine kinase [Ilumatobacter sp.]|uniref:sensor histidine kinase n=1 Tax=Ilumatobacter sp. TaxID=1967498 RepID=UPI0037514313
MRATAASIVIVAIALTIAGVVLLGVLRESQIKSIDTTLELRTNDVAALIDEDGAFETLSVKDDEDGFVQIIDAAGKVVASSTNIANEPRIIAGGEGSNTTMQFPQLDHDDFRVHVNFTASDPQFSIVVGTNLEDVNDVLATTRRSLGIGLPILLLLIAGMIWVVIGRALRPVEAIRSEVADIGGGDLHRRVPEPQTDDEIGRLARTMNAMLDRLETADVAQAQFVSNASHELRTPIAVIRHELEVGLRGDDVLLREIAAEVLEEDVRMQRLVEDLLLLARRDGRAGEALPVARLLVDLDDIAFGEALRVQTDKTVTTSGVSAGQVRGDPDQLARVVRNLLDNALRHAASRVDISVTSTPDGLVVLSIEDDGDGVAEADRERIFERFGRLDEARARDDGGSGLGLAIVAGLVKDHGGTVTVATSPALGGARFAISFTDARL